MGPMRPWDLHNSPWTLESPIRKRPYPHTRASLASISGYFFLFCLADGMTMGHHTLRSLFFVAPSPIFAVSLFFCKDETERSSESSGSACDLKAKLPSLPKRVTQKQRERKSFLGFKKFCLYCMFVLHLCERSEQ